MDLLVKIGDITKENSEAIVNAANAIMLGGGGVDGAIHRAAGPKLIEACRKVPSSHGIRCPEGEARITPAFDLPSEYVIHTVGPRCRQGIPKDGEKNTLMNCWWNSLKLAAINNVKSISFPSISTGAYLFPVDIASTIATNIVEYFDKNYPGSGIEEVRIVCFSDKDFNMYRDAARGERRSTGQAILKGFSPYEFMEEEFLEVERR